MANDTNNMIIVTDQYGRQMTILTNHLPKTPQFFEDGHFEQLDGLLTYEFSTLASDPDTKHLVAGNNVIVRNKDRKLMLFTIIRTVEERKDNKYVRRVFAENAAVDDLYNHIVDGQALVAVTAKDAAEKVLAGTGWKLGIVDYAGLQNVNLHEYPTALAALHQIRDQYGLEMEFTVSFMGMKVRDRFVHLVKRRGNVTGKRFTYGKDLTGVTREVDRSDIATAIIPIGKADETGKRLTIEAFENVHDGYVSPKGQKWVGDEHAMQLYGKNGKHLFKRLDLSSIDNEYELMKKAVEELKRVKQPRATYEVSVLLLESLTGYEHEKVRLGDTILVKDTMFDPALAINARVIAIYRSYTNPSKDYVVLGEFVPLVIDKNRQIEAIQETINQNMTKWEQGGEVVYKSATEPLPSKRTPDMLWLDTSKQPNVMKRWDAEKKLWVNASVTTPEEIGAETPKGAQDKANKAEETAIAEAAEDAAIKAKKAEEKAIEVAEEMDEEIKIEMKSYVEGLTEEVEAEVKKHADQKAKDAELNAKLFAEGYAEKEWHYGETPPEDLTQIWFDMSSTPNKIRKYNEKTKKWEAASPTSPKDIGAETPAETLKKAQDEAKKAQDAAIKQAEEMDRAIKTEAERIAKEAEGSAKQHADEVTKQVEDALKKDVDTKANAARDAAIKKAQELDSALKTESERLAKAAEEAAKGHADSVTKQVEEALKQDAQNKADAAKQGALTEADNRILAARKEAEKNAKTEAERLAEEARKKAEEAAAADAKKKAEEAQRKAEETAKKAAQDEAKRVSDAIGNRINEMSNVGRNLLLGTYGKKHIVNNGEEKSHTYFKFVNSAIKDMQGKTITTTVKMSGKVAAFGTTSPWVGLEIKVSYADGTFQYSSARGETIIKPNVEYNRLVLVGQAKLFDKPIKELSAYALARDFTGGTITLEEFKVGIGTQVTDYDQPLEELDAEFAAVKKHADDKAKAAQEAATKRANDVKTEVENFAKDAGNITQGTLAAQRLHGVTISGKSAKIVDIDAGNITAGTLDAARLKAGSIKAELLEFGGRLRNIAEHCPVTITGGESTNVNGAMTTMSPNVGIWRVTKFPSTATVDLRYAVGEVVEVQFTSYYSNDAKYIPKSFKLETSLDGNTWKTLADVTNNTTPVLKYSNGGTSIRYVRLTVREPQAGQTNTNVSNFQVMALQGGSVMSGDSIITGRIDATKVNVDNLNAGNIKSGTLHADRIGANSINASKLQANSVTTDKLAANSIDASKLQANAVTADKIAANAVNASKIAANAVTSDKVAANAITTDKLHVLAKSLVANTSITGNDSTGWDVSKHATSTVALRGSSNMGDVLVHTITTAEHETPTLYHSKFFEVNPNQTYKFSIGMFVEKNELQGSQYFGLQAYDKNQKELPMQPLNPTNGALSGDPRTNPYFWSGMGTVGQWQFMEGYAVSSQSGGNEAPQGRNIQASYRMHPATKYLRMRFYSGYYPKVKNKDASILWHSPSVTAVDSGTIIADRITAGTIDANKVDVKNINAGNITTGGMSADRITSGTIDARKITVIGLNASNIVSGTIDAAKIGVTNLKAENITSGTLNAARIGANAISADKIAANAITAAKIAAGSISTDKIAAAGISADKITSGTIDARKITVIGINAGNIVSGTIDASKIGVTNLNANNITAGILNADRIGARSISTQKLVVGDFTNLCPNPTFDGGSRAEWDRGTVVAATAAEVPKGKPVPTAHVFKQAERDSYCGEYFPVRSGERFWVEAAAATTTSKHAYGVGLQFQKADGTYIWNAAARRNPTANWDIVGAEIIVPDGAVRARTFAQINATADFGAWYVTNIAVRRRVDSSLIVDGSVHAGKIAANAVTADKVAANAITAGKIAANAVIAGNIAAGSITTDKIAAAGITADKITSGILDANKVQVRNLSAAVITSGTMSADRITGGTINAANTNIINLKAQNIASGTINADNVAISNGRVTINKDGVTVTDANFLVKDAKTGLLHTTLTSTNLLYDHSFELLKSSGNSPVGTYYLDIDWTSISSNINNSFYKWARVGTPKMIDALGYDVPTEAAPFGLRSGLFNQANYVVQRFGATAGKQYTISFHAGKPYGGLAAGAPRIIIEHMKDDTVVASETKDFPVPNANVGEVVRYGHTITANAGIAGGRSASIRVRFLTTNANWCAFDGVQAVTGNRAAPYDAEDSFWKFSQQRLSPPYINAGTIYANRMESDTYDFKYLRGHKQRNILIDHKNNNVTLSAADGNLHLGYEHTTQVFVNSPFMPQKGINVQGKNAAGNAIDAAGNINTWNGNIKANSGDILTNWAVKAAGFTFTQPDAPIWAGEGTMWYGAWGGKLGIHVFLGGGWRLMFENRWAAG